MLATEEARALYIDNGLATSRPLQFVEEAFLYA